jgi:hypothetical protein
MAFQKAQDHGIIRHDESGAARHIRRGGVIPKGWTLDTGESDQGDQGDGKPKRRSSRSKPAENTQGSGPSETGEAGAGTGLTITSAAAGPDGSLLLGSSSSAQDAAAGGPPVAPVTPLSPDGGESAQTN